MSTTEQPAAEHTEPQKNIRTSEEFLPPVTPPTGRFIVQLFVIPAVIVTVIVLLWLLLAGVVLRRSGDPEELIKSLSSPDRWQSAQQLADMLRDERHAQFKRNESAARQLAQIMQRELDRAESGDRLNEKDVTFLMFVARALGEFHVDAGLPTLLRGARLDRNEDFLHVRRAAIEAIAVLTSRLQQQESGWVGAEHGLEERLLALAESDQRLVRSETAFALGVLGTPAAIEKLAKMIRDPYPDARYNAASALARHGDLRALDTLAEMLDPAETAGLRYEDERDIYRFHKRGTILKNALRSTERLARAHPNADFTELMRPLKQLVTADAGDLRQAYIEPVLVSEAERVLEHLQNL